MCSETYSILIYNKSDLWMTKQTKTSWNCIQQVCSHLMSTLRVRNMGPNTSLLTTLIHVQVNLSKYFGFPKMGGLCTKSAVISKWFTWYEQKYIQLKVVSLHFNLIVIVSFLNPKCWNTEPKQQQKVSLSQYYWSSLYLRAVYFLSPSWFPFLGWNCHLWLQFCQRIPMILVL